MHVGVSLLSDSMLRTLGFSASTALWAVAAFAVICPLALSARLPITDRSAARERAWLTHRDHCRKFSEELYRRDRWRAVRGYVTDKDGRPVVGALVQSVRLTSILELVKAGSPTLGGWHGWHDLLLVETETLTDEAGRYEFSHLAVGGRTLCYSAPGKAPAVREVVVVQDGVGARLDVTLEEPRELRVRIDDPSAPSCQLALVPYRWWPNRKAASIGTGVDLFRAWRAFQKRPYRCI